MEFKLNKIDTELRQAIKDSTKEGKVHSSKGIAVNKDKKEDEYSDSQDEHKLNKFKLKKKIIITAIKSQNVQIEGLKEEEENSKGVFLDTKR